jgi:hypothetical protein
MKTQFIINDISKLSAHKTAHCFMPAPISVKSRDSTKATQNSALKNSINQRTVLSTSHKSLHRFFYLIYLFIFILFYLFINLLINLFIYFTVFILFSYT